MGKVIKQIALLILLFFPASGLRSQPDDTLSFSDLFTVALENNFSIIIARNDAEITAINNSPGNAGFLPSVDASAYADNFLVNSNQEFYDGRTREAEGAKNTTMNALAEINWTIFDGAKMFITKEKLSELENQGEILLRIRIEEIYSQLAIAYYGLIQELKWKEVLASTALTSSERLILVNKQYELGSASESELIQARLDLNADSNAIITHEAVIQNLRADINHLAGRDPATHFIPGDKIVSGTIQDYPELLALASRQNQELILARNNEQIRKLEMNESISNFLPSISLYGNYNYTTSRSQSGLLASNESFGPSYGLRFNYNIFNGFNDKRQYEINRIYYENSRVYSAEIQNWLQTELLKSYTNYAAALQVMQNEIANSLDAEKNLSLAIELYRYGQINAIDFRESQKKTIESENRLLRSEFVLKMAELNLLKLSGQLTISQ